MVWLWPDSWMAKSSSSLPSQQSCCFHSDLPPLLGLSLSLFVTPTLSWWCMHPHFIDFISLSQLVASWWHRTAPLPQEWEVGTLHLSCKMPLWGELSCFLTHCKDPGWGPHSKYGLTREKHTNIFNLCFLRYRSLWKWKPKETGTRVFLCLGLMKRWTVMCSMIRQRGCNVMAVSWGELGKACWFRCFSVSLGL
jgi:hypothetical protein